MFVEVKSYRMVVKCLKRIRSAVCFEWPQRLYCVRAVLVIIGGFTVNLTLSDIWTFGNMEPYIVSYIRNRSHPTDLRTTVGAWIFTATVLGQGIAVLLGGWLNSKLGPRVTALIGGWTMSSGVLLSYFTIQTSFWLFTLTYGLIAGVGVGIAYVSPISAAMKWMPNWKGVSNGFMLAGYGVGILLFDVVQTAFCNPNNGAATSNYGHKDENYFTDPEVLNRIPYTFLVLGGSYAVLQLLGSVLLTDPPEHYLQQNETSTDQEGATYFRAVDDDDIICPCTWPRVTAKTFKGKKSSFFSVLCRVALCLKASSFTSQQSVKTIPPEDDDSDSDDQSGPEEMQLLSGAHGESMSLNEDRQQLTSVVPFYAVIRRPYVSLRPIQMLKQVNFYILWIMFMLDGIAISYVVTYYKAFGFITREDDHFLAVVGAVSALCDTSGSVVWGLLVDKLSFKAALIFLNATFTVFLLTFYACSVGGQLMFILWVCVLWFCVAGIYTIYPTAIARSFGLKYVSVNYPLLFTSQIAASITTSLIGTFLFDYIFVYGTMLLVSGLLFVSFILSLFYHPRKYILL